jgi:uncharacterized protein YabN with tetrapyrrole methylase and pyrophosphatase domain
VYLDSYIFSKENIKTIDKVIEKWENVKRPKESIVLGHY